MTDVVVRDGSTAWICQAGEGDVGTLVHFLQSPCSQGVYYRFHGRPALTDSRVCALVGLDGSPAKAVVVETASLAERLMGPILDEFARTEQAPERAFGPSLTARGSRVGAILGRRAGRLRLLHRQSVARLRRWRGARQSGAPDADAGLIDLPVTVNAIASVLGTGR